MFFLFTRRREDYSKHSFWLGKKTFSSSHLEGAKYHIPLPWWWYTNTMQSTQRVLCLLPNFWHCLCKVKSIWAREIGNKKKVSILVFKTFGCTVQGGMEVNGNSVSYLSILSNNCMIHKNSLGNRDHNLRCSPPTHKYSVAHKYYCFCFLITLAWKKDLANSLRWIWMSFIWRLTQVYPPFQGNLW